MKKKESLGKRGLPSEGKLVEEGTAKVFFQGDVFYNPVQVFNRDLSIHVIKEFDNLRREDKSKGRRMKNKKIRDLKILEALSATGLRSIRYVKEIPNVALMVANDISKEAAEAIHRNAVSNGCDTKILQASHNDAVLLMHQHKIPPKQFDVVDLDPYGAPTIFLDSAVQAVTEGGLLCVTCTDAPVLCAVYPETCYAKYNAIPVKSKFCHEMALRILLHCISTHASRYGRYIEPLISVSTDFYIRVFVRVFTGKLQVKLNPTKQAYVHQAVGIPSFLIRPVAVNKRPKQPNNPHVVTATSIPRQETDGFYGRNHHIAGPIWCGPIHNVEFVKRLLNNMGGPECPKVPKIPGGPVGRRWKKMHGVLTAINEESECFDCPLYYNVPDLANTVHCSCPPLHDFMSALLNAGYRVSNTHAKANSVKTDAPNEVVWDIIRAWVSNGNPVSKKRLTATSPATAILSKPSTIKVDFTIHSRFKDKDGKKLKKNSTATRFLPNPEKYWGPKSRAKKKKIDEESTESSKKRKVSSED